MNRFPLGIDLQDQAVYLIGSGQQIRQKREKLAPFGARLIQKDTFTEADAKVLPAMVIVGDTPTEQAREIFCLCSRYRIPVNVVDVPQLCSFYFPALITRGELTISISTGGSNPAAAAYLRQHIAQLLPEATEQILSWLWENKAALKEQQLLQPAIAAAFSLQRPLQEEELMALKTTLP